MGRGTLVGGAWSGGRFWACRAGNTSALPSSWGGGGGGGGIGVYAILGQLLGAFRVGEFRRALRRG